MERGSVVDGKEEFKEQQALNQLMILYTPYGKATLSLDEFRKRLQFMKKKEQEMIDRMYPGYGFKVE